MIDRPDCQEFQERLEQLVARSLAPADVARLESHAADCPECALLMRMQRHLTAVSADALAAAVPDRLVEGMWPRVQADLAAGPAVHERATRPPRPWRAWPRPPQLRAWLAPALAVCLVLLAFVCGSLWGEIRQLKQQRQDLTQELQLQQLQLASYHDRTADMLARQTTALIDRASWRQAIAGRDEFTAAELVALLGQLPPETPLLSEEDTRHVLQRGLEWHRLLRLHIPRDVQIRDGLQAEEVIRIIDELDLPPNQKISRSRLLTLAASRAPAGDR